MLSNLPKSRWGNVYCIGAACLGTWGTGGSTEGTSAGEAAAAATLVDLSLAFLDLWNPIKLSQSQKEADCTGWIVTAGAAWACSTAIAERTTETWPGMSAVGTTGVAWAAEVAGVTGIYWGKVAARACGLQKDAQKYVQTSEVCRTERIFTGWKSLRKPEETSKGRWAGGRAGVFPASQLTVVTAGTLTAFGKDTGGFPAWALVKTNSCWCPCSHDRSLLCYQGLGLFYRPVHSLLVPLTLTMVSLRPLSMWTTLEALKDEVKKAFCLALKTCNIKDMHQPWLDRFMAGNLCTVRYTASANTVVWKKIWQNRKGNS